MITNFFLKILKRNVEFLYVFLSFFVKKKAETLLFYSKKGYYDNVKSLFEYCVDNEINAYYITWTKNKTISKPYKNRVIYIWSIKAAYLSLISKYNFISFSAIGDMTFLASGRNKIITNLWHGTPIKNIALNDTKILKNKKSKKYLIRDKSFYSYFTVSSDIERYYMCNAFNLPLDNVIVTGLARYDNFYCSNERYKEKLGLNNKKIILYAPTFRDDNQAIEFFPYNKNLEAIIKIAEEYNVMICLRPHKNDLSAIKQVKNLVEMHNCFYDLSNSKLDDINLLLPELDGLITDYSSIFIDTLLIDIPVMFVPYDLKEYTLTRSFAYDYDLVTPGPKVRNHVEFEKGMINMLSNQLSAYAEHRYYVKKMFHKFENDGQNCQRILDIVTVK